MKKIDFNFDLHDLNNNKFKETAGQVVAGLLVSGSSGDAIKYFDWAVKLNKGESISVDESDFIKIRDLIKNSENIAILAKAPMLKYLENVK